MDLQQQEPLAARRGSLEAQTVCDTRNDPALRLFGKITTRRQSMVGCSPASPEILLIEDEPLIAMYVEDALTRSGFTVAGPFETLADGTEAARRFGGAAALVDLRLQGDDATVVTEILASRNIPFVVMTGGEDIALPSEIAVPVLRKPFLIGDLLQTIRSVCAT
jgi:DNA-binding NtrC family response regulator